MRLSLQFLFVYIILYVLFVFAMCCFVVVFLLMSMRCCLFVFVFLCLLDAARFIFVLRAERLN